MNLYSIQWLNQQRLMDNRKQKKVIINLLEIYFLTFVKNLKGIFVSRLIN